MLIRMIVVCLIIVALFPLDVDGAIPKKQPPPAPVFDPYTEVTSWLWPKKPETKAPTGKARPVKRTPTRPSQPPPPAVEQPQKASSVATPQPRPKVKKTKTVKAANGKKVKTAKPGQRRAVAKPTAGISASDCARVRSAYAKWGDRINAGGQGYSPADVAYARRACRV